MKRISIVAGGVAVIITVCCGTVYAAAPVAGSGVPGLGREPVRGPGIHLQAVGLPPSTLQAFAPGREAATPEEVIGRLAYKISYVGSVLLTADRVLRSVDSILDSMEWNRADGTCLRLCAEPASRGFEVGVRISRPIEF